MTTDLHFDSVSLLLHCDGANGSIAFVDSSPEPKTITALASAKVTTAQSMFGGACLSVLTGGRLVVNAGEGCTFGADDFTVEMWVKTDASGVRYFMGQDSQYGYASWAMGIDDGKFFWVDTNPSADWFLVKSAVTVNDGQWRHFAVARQSGVLRLFVDGVPDGSHAGTSAYSATGPCGIANISGYYDPSNSTKGYIDELRVTKGVARYTNTFAVPTAAFPGAPATAGIATAPGLLGAAHATAFFGDRAAARVAAAGPLGAPRVLATASAFLTTAIASAPSPLGRAVAKGLHDFTGLLGDASTRYVMDLITPTGRVRVPISSWQATLQTGSSNYVQCVVPACAAHVAQINSATEFVIYRRAELPDGSALEYEMARAPTGQVRFDRGPQRHTCTLAGYSTAFVADENPPVAYNRDLVAVRSISSGQGGMRVRCAVDWLLRPGHRAFADGVPLVVSYINYYAPSGGDGYMDVGERT